MSSSQARRDRQIAKKNSTKKASKQDILELAQSVSALHDLVDGMEMFQGPPIVEFDEERFPKDLKGKTLRYSSHMAAGFDIAANLPDEGKVERQLSISPGSTALIPTGLYLTLMDSDYEIQIRSRSGLAAKHAVIVTNAPGTIDADYRGEIKVILTNHGSEAFTIKHGDRIAQGVLSKVYRPDIEASMFFTEPHDDDDHRGEGGFGSTGV